MKTIIQLRKGNVCVATERTRFLKVLEVLEEEHEELREIRLNAKDADEICWSSESNVVYFKYEEQREWKECSAYVASTENGIFVLEAFLLSEVMR